ncbi:MAG TPA: DUF3105 domain-containing protein [Candidatus Limnocylindrales bacterium]|nr:DUF3105 domain-containing protein [Candidatus Limnocylindrales bacterium]
MSRTQRELKALRQQQREEAARRQRAQDRRSLLLVGAGVLVVGLAIWVTAVYLGHQGSGGHLAFTAYSGPTLGTQVADEGTPSHIDPATTWNYKNYPPTSGPHYAQPDGPAPWQTDQAMREGTYLHNLEHGGIAILYNCPSGSDCTTLKNQLDAYVQNLVPAEPQFNEYKIVMTPYARGMTHKVALLAWHYIQFLDGYDQNAITKFYEDHVNQGPEHIA